MHRPQKTTRSPTQASKTAESESTKKAPPLGKRGRPTQKKTGNSAALRNRPWNKLFQRFAPKGVPQKAFLTLFTI